MSVLRLPEIQAFANFSNRIRIPPELDVPVTGRAKKLIDTEPFRRLSKISQLGLVSLVYPGATHSRFEHSLGVYRLGLMYLQQLAIQDDFATLVSEEDAASFLVAALFHDVGHWPFCHAIEDLRLPGIERHEALARKMVCETEIADRLRLDWGMEPELVLRWIAPRGEPPSPAILSSMLSGPVDIDKMDYLERDSLHAGVPYGRNFDRQRLIAALCMGPQCERLAITRKGRTAAEMMVFARYVMFSEVYWHPAVRSATAMLQRAIYEWQRLKDVPQSWLMANEPEMIRSLLSEAPTSAIRELLDGLFGSHRRLYKRVAQFDCLSLTNVHQALARRPYPQLVDFGNALAERVGHLIGQTIPSEHLLIDAPPVKLEVQFQVSVRMDDGSFDSLENQSPVVRSLATRQFDDMVKKVRIFVPPHLQERIRRINMERLVTDLIEEREVRE